MKKIFLTAFSILLLSSFGCQSENEETSNNDVDNVIMVTGDQAGSWLTIGAGITELANEYFDGSPFTATPGPGSVGNPASVFTGDAEIGMSYAPFLLEAVSGEEPFEEEMTNLRSIAALTETVVHFFQNADTNYNSIQDMIENEVSMTLGLPPTGQGSNYIAQIIFNGLGIENIEEELKKFGGDIYYGSGTDLVDGWRDKHVDAVLSTYNVPASAVDESLASRNGKLMNIGDELTGILIRDRGFTEYVIPKGTYSDQDFDVTTVSLPIILFTREDVSEDTIYNLTKAIYENQGTLESIHNSFESFDVVNMAIGLGLEMHSGAEKFYKEVGLID